MTEYLDRYPTMHEYAEGKRINPKLTDLISRADAIEAVRSYFKDRMGKSKCDYDEELQVYVISKEERTMLTYNKGINDKLRSLPSAELPKGDLISRADVLKYPIRLDHYDEVNGNRVFVYGVESVIEYVESLPSADAVHGEWIPCSKKMPKELERVNVTWLNHNPPFYYQHIKDIPQIDTAVYYRGKWYWWDATVIDVLAEYGEDCNAEQIDIDIEILAWQPLPTPYKGGDTE